MRASWTVGLRFSLLHGAAVSACALTLPAGCGGEKKAETARIKPAETGNAATKDEPKTGTNSGSKPKPGCIGRAVDAHQDLQKGIRLSENVTRPKSCGA